MTYPMNLLQANQKVMIFGPAGVSRKWIDGTSPILEQGEK